MWHVMDAIAFRKVSRGSQTRRVAPALITIPMAHVLRYTNIRRGVLLIANYSAL